MTIDWSVIDDDPKEQIAADGEIWVERDGPQHVGRFWKNGDDRKRYVWIRDLIKTHAPNKRVIDVGCNIGEILRLLIADKVIEPTDAYGIDIDQAYVLLARERVKGTFFCGAMENITERTGLHDLGAVIAAEVIEHVFDPQRAVNALANVLPPGGVLLFTTPDDNQWARQYAVEHPNKHRHVFDTVSLTGFVQSAGLVVISVDYTPQRADGLQMLLLAARKE